MKNFLLSILASIVASVVWAIFQTIQVHSLLDFQLTIDLLLLNWWLPVSLIALAGSGYLIYYIYVSRIVKDFRETAKNISLPPAIQETLEMKASIDKTLNSIDLDK